MINLYKVETNSNETKLHIILRLKKNSVMPSDVNWFLLGFVLSFDKFFYSEIFSPILFF